MRGGGAYSDLNVMVQCLLQDSAYLRPGAIRGNTMSHSFKGSIRVV